jgi:xanthine dehydrogenase accessory factor
MFNEFLNKANELIAKSEAFAVAMVVRYEAPISGKPGDKAIIFANGEVWGWIGGGCAQPAVVREALKSLEDGQSRLVRISPSSSAEEGVVDYTMTCHSGGALDIYIEPVLPKPLIVILGRSLVAQTLARLGKAIHYTVSVAAPKADRESFPDADSVRSEFDLQWLPVTSRTFLVVSTQGEGDDEALEKALETQANYVTLVASKAKAAKILGSLRERGVPAERLKQVRAPAGLKFRASSPEEIAVSILAEIVQLNATRAVPPKTKAALPVSTQEAKDPICGMTIDRNAAKYKSEVDGRWFYFCCAGCKQKFDKQSEKYLLDAPSLTK